MLPGAIKIIAILLAAFFSRRAMKIFFRKLKIAQKKQRVKTLTSLLVNTSTLIINATALLLILSELGINIAPLLTGVGILGLAVGFGARSLVADFIAGFFILLENQFNLDDEVNLGGNWQGKVIKISLRTTTLKDKEGKIYIIPNSAIKAVIIKPPE